MFDIEQHKRYRSRIREEHYTEGLQECRLDYGVFLTNKSVTPNPCLGCDWHRHCDATETKYQADAEHFNLHCFAKPRFFNSSNSAQSCNECHLRTACADVVLATGLTAST